MARATYCSYVCTYMVQSNLSDPTRVESGSDDPDSPGHVTCVNL